MWLNNPDPPPAHPQTRDIVASASLVLGVLEIAKVRCWDDMEPPITVVELTPSQRRMIYMYEHIARLQRAKIGQGSIRVSIACCTVCTRWMLLPSGVTLSGKCPLSLECEGKLVRAKPPARSRTQPEPFQPSENM